MRQYLESKGLQFKHKAGEQVTLCPFCKEETGHLYVNETKNVFFCHKCGEAGNIWKLKKHYGDVTLRSPQSILKYKKPPENRDKELNKTLNEVAMEYLKVQRGLKEPIIKQHNLGYDGEYISFPYYKDKQLANIKYRSINDKKFKREKDCESTLYNQDNIDFTKDVIVVEGEIDCLSAVQMGYENTVSTSLGASGFDPSWIDFFDSCSGKIYIAYDNDEMGNTGADKVAKRIGLDRCYRVKLPQKDMNECLMSGEDIKSFVDEAENYKLPNLRTMTEAIDKTHATMFGDNKGKGHQLRNSPRFNEKLGGIRLGEITVITGETGSGKTTFGLNLTYNLIPDDKAVLIASTEMKIQSVVKKLYAIHMQKPFHEFSQEEYDEAVRYFITKNIYFVDIHGRLSIESITDYIEYAQRKYNVEYVFLDHLHFFIDPNSDKPVVQIEKFIRDLVIITHRLDVAVFLVAHPAKLKNDLGMVNMNDLKGASAIKQDAHNIITLWRDKKKEEKGVHDVYVNLEKVRDDSGIGGKMKYSFDPKSQIFLELT